MSAAPVTAEAAPAQSFEPLPQDGNVEVDQSDSAYCSEASSDTTSISSSIYRGVIQNGRRYQSLKEGEYWGPSDEKQFSSMETQHIMYLTLDGQAPNPFFYAPVRDGARRILDIGTGNGSWAIDVADQFPDSTVVGVDLHPPPETWVPPNLIFEVDDVSQPWTWSQKFDLIHMRILMGAFTPEGWESVYRQAYENLEPGGWIEQFEDGGVFHNDDGALPKDPQHPINVLGRTVFACGEKSGRPLNMVDTMKASIEKAGFVNVHEKLYKVPIGGWAKHPILKEVGRLNLQRMLDGMEGYTMFLMTHFGEPEPWTPEQVKVFLAEKLIPEMSNIKYHCYGYARRVWAQKPLN